MQESATLALNARVKELKQSGKPVYNLTAGELDGETPKQIQLYVSKKLNQNKYTPTAGLPELRQLISKYESKRLARRISERNVVVTSGAKTALFTIFQALLNKGDEVILPTPAWVSYAHMIELAGGKVVKVPLKENNDLDAMALSKKITKKTKLVIINSPHNPTGSVFSKAELEKFARTIKKKNIYVLTDEIYESLTYGKKFFSVARAGLNSDQLIVVNGFSKSQALTGWRIGYVVSSDIISDALNSFLSHSSGNASVPAQLAAQSALLRGNKPTMYKILHERRLLVEKELNKIDQIDFVIPEGAFYFWLDLRKITKNSAGWCEALLNKTGVALVPGEAFFAPGFARLSFASDNKTLKTATRLIANFVKGEENK